MSRHEKLRSVQSLKRKGLPNENKHALVSSLRRRFKHANKSLKVSIVEVPVNKKQSDKAIASAATIRNNRRSGKRNFESFLGAFSKFIDRTQGNMTPRNQKPQKAQLELVEKKKKNREKNDFFFKTKKTDPELLRKMEYFYAPYEPKRHRKFAQQKSMRNREEFLGNKHNRSLKRRKKCAKDKFSATTNTPKSTLHNQSRRSPHNSDIDTPHHLTQPLPNPSLKTYKFKKQSLLIIFRKIHIKFFLKSLQRNKKRFKVSRLTQKDQTLGRTHIKLQKRLTGQSTEFIWVKRGIRNRSRKRSRGDRERKLLGNGKRVGEERSMEEVDEGSKEENLGEREGGVKERMLIGKFSRRRTVNTAGYKRRSICDEVLADKSKFSYKRANNFGSNRSTCSRSLRMNSTHKSSLKSLNKTAKIEQKRNGSKNKSQKAKKSKNNECHYISLSKRMARRRKTIFNQVQERSLLKNSM
ncbi:unnamed protein product [Moneuplotes crassus]|uniref:Uncharacterized protein n=1 Tax=Euplotes crassus TaxID=5936 RepID=A0AAD2D9X0_EUPCR|nr:unnamed protein product [Moneuplotes crassus]